MDAMDMMVAVEEEKRLRELQDLHDAIVLDDAYFTKRNLSGRGRNIVPSGKHKRDLQAVSMNIRFGPALSRRRSTGSIGNREEDWGVEDSSKLSGELDLTAKPRVFLYSGMLTQYDPGICMSCTWCTSCIPVTHARTNTQTHTHPSSMKPIHVRVSSITCSMYPCSTYTYTYSQYPKSYMPSLIRHHHICTAPWQTSYCARRSLGASSSSTTWS
ncbi:hypothetical protein EON64_16610 [archaeon]|nr:MAG: hypothetical protein EON64_16610 [archaeon]